MAKKKVPADTQDADYHHQQQATQRPDVGVQDQFSTRKPPKAYRYDSSLDPQLSWNENRDRELGEWLLGLIDREANEGEPTVFEQPQVWAGGGIQVQSLRAAVDLLKRLSQPFLNWAGKAERHQISVPTVPLFVHERHSTKAILEGVRNRRAKNTTLDLFGDSQLDLTDRLEAYEHKGPWANRMILGDSLQVMNSLLEFEGLGGQIQMIYMDPPYGVKFGSNFQPFVRKRDVKHGGDDDMTREPEMVRAYRDTRELGLHSYLTYLRDRLNLCRELLHPSGSIFIQISSENRHHVRELLDEVFGTNNFISEITFVKTSGSTGDFVPQTTDYLLMYARDITCVKYRQLYQRKEFGGKGASGYNRVYMPDGTTRPLMTEEKAGKPLPSGARLYCLDNHCSAPGDALSHIPADC